MEFINFEPFSFGGEIGRRAGFKIQFLRECGFDSRPRYHTSVALRGRKTKKPISSILEDGFFSF